ncbi:retrovirus-related pol polyprotein from transposon TNT 1-94 [Tanacetum coccineum]|uniref:Retrovirus-related pol polyprotein from transposon TNT 1-94 n=1 Tax=Tanacetum coccineum TaxID=301880 RepID=A0ABQ5ERR8_9ASTR
MNKGKSEKGLVAKSFDWDEESVPSDDEGVTTFKALMAVVVEELSVGRADARSGQWVEITMKNVQKLLSITGCDERKHVLDYTHVDLHYVEDQRKNLLSKYNSLKQEFSLYEISNLKKVIEKWTSSRVTLDQLLTEHVPRNIVRALEGKDMRKYKISSKEVMFTKSDISSSKTCLELPSDSESEGYTQKPLPSLTKLIGVEPSGITKCLTLPKTKQATNKVVPVNVKQKTKTKSPHDLPTEKLLLTLMEEVKGLKEQIQTHSETSPPTSQSGSFSLPKEKDYLKRYIWYLDSGCSRHMTGIKQYLHRYSKESGPKVVFGDNSSGNTEGYGSVNCNGITFTKFTYVNGLKHNLISISQLCDANFKVLFTKTQGTIFNQNNEVVLIALRSRDVYVIDMTSYNEESNACFLAKASPSVNWLWHKRLSHLNFKNINTLAKQNLVVGLPSLTFSKDKTGSACEKGKHHRASFKTKRSFSINKCLHLLHMDLKMENLNEVKVKELKSDNRTEFKNHKLEEFCDEQCISQNFSSPLKRHGKTTYDVFRGRSLDISYFHAFGCPMHIHNHRDHLGKFDEKADDGFFLGYSLVAKAFRDSISPKEHAKLSHTNNDQVLNEPDHLESANNPEHAKVQISLLTEQTTKVSHPPLILLQITNPLAPQDRWSREKHIELVNIICEPLGGITTRSKIKDSEAASAHECLYVNFLSEIEPKKLIEALEKEG